MFVYASKSTLLRIGLAIFVTTVTACTQLYVTDEAVQYNRAIADFTNKEILLNAVRASKRRPLSYMAISGGIGTLTRGGTMSTAFSFPRNIDNFRLNTFAVNPSINASSNNNFQVENL